MKYKVPKEELDALFREVYNLSKTTEDYYISSPLKKKDEYKFLAYKYKKPIKSFLLAQLPFKFQIKNFAAFEGNSVPEDNLFITGYDVEKKYRLYITANENLEEILNKKLNSDIHKLTGEKFNPQNLIDRLSEDILQYLKKDFPFIIKKINTPYLQFYEDEFIKLEYKIEIGGFESEISIWIEKSLVEAGDISPFVFSPPTLNGKKKINSLKELIEIEYIVETKPLEMSLDQLKLNNEIDIELKIKENIG